MLQMDRAGSAGSFKNKATSGATLQQVCVEALALVCSRDFPGDCHMQRGEGRTQWVIPQNSLSITGVLARKVSIWTLPAVLRKKCQGCFFLYKPCR